MPKLPPAVGLCACFTLSAQAASVTAGFSVTVTLQPPQNGVCTSTALSHQTQAQVRVVCSTGEFVSIQANPGQGFGLAHGGAYQYIFIERLVVDPAFNRSTNDLVGAGTVTSARVLNLTNSLSNSDERLELLVSF